MQSERSVEARSISWQAWIVLKKVHLQKFLRDAEQLCLKGGTAFLLQIQGPGHLLAEAGLDRSCLPLGIILPKPPRLGSDATLQVWVDKMWSRRTVAS